MRIDPGPLGLASEVVTIPKQWACLALRFDAAVRESPRGDGHTVLVIPGLTAGDLSTAPLRKFLCDIGYNAVGWGRGINLGLKPDDEIELEKQVVGLAANGPVTLVGWSLGGIYAREAGRRRPELIRHVVTMGTPIRSLAGSEWLHPFIKAFNPDWKLELSDESFARRSMPLPVPTTAIYSLSDGVVAGETCQIPEADVGPAASNVRVYSSHLGMGFDTYTYRVLARKLTQV